MTHTHTNGTNTTVSKVEPRCYSNSSAPSLPALKSLVSLPTGPETYPLATTVSSNVPIYDCTKFQPTDPQTANALQDELYHNLLHGPGAYVLRSFFPASTHGETIDPANEAFSSIVADEAAAVAAGQRNEAKGDHFAPASANSRIWNSFQKHGERDPQGFVRYWSNPWWPLVCESYLGPGYRMTSQVNIVKPGGQAQTCHRDYHLGFQSDADVVAWPKAVHHMSALLTLQGAVAHTDMPLDSGPTRLLPHSQKFDQGFRAYRTQEFIDFFQQNYVALALEKGDALFFSPALFHAAGENRTAEFSRSANLVQVSSAFGKTMETVDSAPLIEKTFSLLRQRYKAEGMSSEVDAFVRNVAEGYPFPTNLDCRPPGPGKMAPESEQELLRRGLSEGWDEAKMMKELTDMRIAGSANGKVSQ